MYFIAVTMVRGDDNNASNNTNHWTYAQNCQISQKITNIISLFIFWVFFNGSIAPTWSRSIELVERIIGGVTLWGLAFLTGEI